jgi:cell division initiation protein
LIARYWDLSTTVSPVPSQMVKVRWMADFDTAEFRASRFSRSATEEIANRSFPVAMRGYDRAAVDAFVQEVLQIVTDLEGLKSQESVVQRALEEVGEETAGILQRAHETADEITARSRAQAEGRIQRAEREAELVRRQADAYSEKIVVDTRLLWEERQRLIEDIRQLADDVLGTAEEALDPEAADTEAAPPTEEDGPPTSEVELDLLPGGAADEDEDADDEETTRSD